MPNYSKSTFEPGTTKFKGSGVMSRSKRYGPTGMCKSSPKKFRELCVNCGHPFGRHYVMGLSICPRLVKPTKSK